MLLLIEFGKHFLHPKHDTDERCPILYSECSSIHLQHQQISIFDIFRVSYLRLMLLLIELGKYYFLHPKYDTGDCCPILYSECSSIHPQHQQISIFDIVRVSHLRLMFLLIELGKHLLHPKHATGECCPILHFECNNSS